MAIVVNYHDDLNEVQGDAALLALLGPDHARAPFDRFEWWQGLAECCNFTPLMAVARDGALRAMLPLRRDGRKLVALANWYSFRIKAPVSPQADALALFTALATDLAGEAPHVVLSPVPNCEGDADLLEAAFRAGGWAVFRERCDYNHILEVGGRNYADYIAGRPGQVRTTLKRKASKVDVTLSSHFDPAEWAAYEAIYAQSWKPSEDCPGFLRRFAEQEGAAGRLRLAVARHAGEPVAAQFWTVEAGTAFIHKLAHTEASKPLSPGTTLSAALFEHVIDRDKVTLVDFGTGNDGYKRDWMEQQRPRYRIEAFRPGWPGNWPLIARRALHGLAARLRGG